MKKLVSILLTLAVCICSMPIICVSAAGVDGNFEFEIINGEYAEITDYNGSLKNITIPSIMNYNNYLFYPVKGIGNYAFSGINANSIVLPEGVTYIGEFAFWETELISITLPSSLQKISNAAFSRSEKINQVYYNGNLSSWCNIEFGWGSNPAQYGADLYINNNLLTDLVIPDDVKEIKALAFNGVNIEELTVPGSVKTIQSGAFSNCKKLKKATLLEGVNAVYEDTFLGCDELELAVLPNSFEHYGEENIFSEENNKLIIHGYKNSSANDYANYCGIPFLEHSFTVDTGKYIEPTCTKSGGNVLKCSYCKEELLNTPALGHNFSNWYNTVNPTCISTGIAEQACSRCNAKKQRTVAKLGHKYGSWITSVAPTCYSKGQKYRICSNCGKIEYGTIAMVSHKIGKWEFENEPTYFKKGKKMRVCTVCGLALENKAIPKLKLKTPTIKKIKGKKGNKKITFSKVKGASYYEIWDYQYIYYENYAKTYKWKKYKTIKSTSCSLRDWKDRAYYSYVKVRAVVKKGNKKVYSKFSKVKIY